MPFADISELSDLHQALPQFVQDLHHFAERIELNLAQHCADHIAVRCYQQTTADRWRAGLLRCADLASEKMINGRPICLFRLYQPLTIGPWQIDFLELPYPGEKLYPRESWEHVELVLGVEPEQLHPAALAALSDTALREPGIKLKFSQPAGEGESLPNPTLAITDGKVTIKFHPYPIEQIIASQSSLEK